VPFSERPGALANLRPADPAPVARDLANRAGSPDDLWRRQVAACAAVDARWDWAPVLDQVKNRLNAQNAPAAGLISAALALYRAEPKKVVEALNPARQSGWLFAHGATMTEARDLAQWATAVLITEPNPSPQSSPQPNWTNNGRQKYQDAVQKGAAPGVAAIAEAVFRSGARDAVLGNYPRWQEIRTVIAKLSEMDLAWPSAAELVTRENDWRGILGNQGYARRLAENREAAAVAAVKLPFDPSRAPLYAELREPLPAPAGLDDFLRAGLRGLDKAQWTAAIEQGGSLLAIAAALAPGLDLHPASGLQDALEGAGRSLLKGGQIAADPEQLEALLAGLGLSSQSALRDKLGEAAFGGGASIGPLVAKMGPWLDAGPPTPDMARRFIDGFLAKAAERAGEPEIAWAARYAAKYEKELRQVSGPLRQDAANRLRKSGAAAGGDGIRASIEEIADVIAG
jgi:hypothetical protein